MQIDCDWKTMPKAVADKLFFFQTIKQRLKTIAHLFVQFTTIEKTIAQTIALTIAQAIVKTIVIALLIIKLSRTFLVLQKYIL